MAWNTKQLSIESIDCIGEKEVFDIEMPVHHNFFANGVLAHNCHQFPWDDDDTQYKKIVDEFRRRNPKLKVIGFTGSPWRGSESILEHGKLLDGKGEQIKMFWKKQLASIDREYLTRRGFVMPTVFGFGSAHYQIDMDFNPDYQSNSDFSKSQLASMENEILKDKTTTQEIMSELAEVMKNRNLALITCSGRKHCEEAAKFLPDGEYVIITEKTSPKKRIEIKDKCNIGELKYVLQIGTWSTGISINRLDTIVMLRRIGSMSLYEQLIGRGVRKLKQVEIDAGVIKNDCMVLDYTDTTEKMALLFNSEELDYAAKTKAQEDNNTIECPDCGEHNSMTARRCCGTGHDGNRCEFFFNYKTCEHCQTKNDTTARTCRQCGEWMIDPNEKISRTHYTDADYKEVLGWNVQLSNDQKKVIVTYVLENREKAMEMFMFDRSKVWMKATWRKFVNEHVEDKFARKSIANAPTAIAASAHFSKFARPEFITHRLNDKGYSVINRKVMPWHDSPFKEIS